MNIYYTENKEYYNEKLQVWKLEITINYKHKKFVKKKEYYYFGSMGDVKGYYHKIFTKERYYPKEEKK